MPDDQETKCSFCGKGRQEVANMVRGARGVVICDQCVEKANKVIDAQRAQDLQDEATELVPPTEIKAFLDQYVIGQNEAKKALSVAVFNHYLRLFDAAAGMKDDVEIEKANILLLGPTGCGKTLLAKTIARLLNVPISIGDATTLTEAGFVGDDVESLVSNLMLDCGGDPKRAERGIVFIDEIDKIGRRNTTETMVRDVRGEGVQQALLKLIEGNKVMVPAPGHRRGLGGPEVQIDTTNILFIVSGAFPDLHKIISKRVNQKGAMGFGNAVDKDSQTNEESDLLEMVTTEDLKQFGFIPEFIGRIPVTVALQELTEDELIQILTEPRNAIVKQKIREFDIGAGVTLEFTDAALRSIAKVARKEKRGARGLRAIIEPLLRDTMYELPAKRGQYSRVVVTDKVVDGEEKPTLVKAKAEATG